MVEKFYLINFELVENMSDFDIAMNIIKERIPCFIEEKLFSDECNIWSLIIKCRESDVKFVETMLAPFV